MKILHVFKTYLPESFTGVERVIWQICEGAAAHGVASEVFCLSRETSGAAIEVGTHRVHAARTSIDLASSPFSLTAFALFNRLVADADLVHYHFPWPMMDLLHMTARHSRPSLVTYHSDIVKQARLMHLYRPVMNRFLGKVDRIVATSPNYAASSAVLRAFSGKVSVIPIGIDPAALVADPQDIARWRQRLPPRFFLFVGALRYYKGLPFLLEAARMSGLPVVVAGGRADEPPMPVPPGLTFVGRVSDGDKAALLALCESFVFPSHLRSEAFGVALLEAAFAGKAMISCEIGTGTSYVNADGETGLIVAPADPEALAGAMRAIWDDPARSRRFGIAAKARAEKLFRASDMVDRYVALYAEMLAGRAGRPALRQAT